MEFVKNGNHQTKQYFIISFDKIKNKMSSLTDEENELFVRKKIFSLLVFDEAHHAKNKNTNIYEAILKIRKICDKVILLTATPIHNSSKDLYNLLTIVDESVFENEDIFKSVTQNNSTINKAINLLREYDEDGDYLQQNEEIADSLIDIFATNNDWINFINSKHSIHSIIHKFKLKKIITLEFRNKVIDVLERANPLSNIINRTRKKDIDKFTQRKIINIHTKFNKEELTFYDGIIKYFIKKCSKSDNQVVTTKKRKVNYFITCGIEKVLASSIKNFTNEETLEQFCKKMTIKELFNTLGDDPSINELVDDINNSPLNDIDFSIFKDLAQKINDQPDDKANKLVEHIRKIFDVLKFKKLIIFSSYKKTLNYLANIIKTNFPNKNICVISGNNKEIEREKIRERFSYGEDRPDRIDILLSSEISGEGLDFQFCSVVVNYDMP
jgi:superfamily II DNA or RNA helicase